MSLNKIIALSHQDLVLEAQLERITYQANDENRGTKNIIRDRITTDMVDTFNKQFKTPITKRVNETDEYGNPIPEVDENGDDREDAEGNTIYKTKEVQYKYRTPEMDLDLEAVNPFELEHVLTEAEIKKSKKDASDLVQEYQQNELVIERLKTKIQEAIKAINLLADKHYLTPSKKGSQERRQKFKIKGYEAEIARIIVENGNIEAEIIRLRKEIQDNEGNEAHNDGVRRSVMKRNADKVNAYSNELSSLNRGQFRMDKYPDETDEDFVKRLRDVGQTEYEESDQYDSAYLSNMTQFKTNMKNITRDEALIDSLLRSMSPEELFKLNQKFPLYKSEFLKIYGAFNKTINYEDVVETIKIFLVKGSLNVGSDRNNTAPQILQGNELVAGKFTYSKHANDTLAIQNIENQNILYLKVSKTTDNKGLLKRHLVLASKTGDKGSFVSIGMRMSAQRAQNNPDESLKHLFVDYLEINSADSEKIFNKARPSLEDIANFVKHYVKDTPFIELHEVERRNQGKIYGYGIQPNEELPKHCAFGKVIIELDKLYYKNILAVKDKKLRNISGFKNTPVSDDFVEIIMNMCRDSTMPKKSEISGLSGPNTELWNLLIHYSGLHKSNVDTSKNETIKNLKERLQLVEGEIEAGNDNDEVVDELRSILMKLKNLNVITSYQAINHFKQLTKH